MSITQGELQALIASHPDLSGVVYVRQAGEVILAQGYGYANRADCVPNQANTRFGIASGTKTLTAVAVCQLVEQGKISFDTRLKDCLDIPFPQFDPGVTVHHLLCHTSGIPDYFDEDQEADASFEALWRERPMYTMRQPQDFLPLFQNLPMKFAPGERFGYNNAGYIVLGLLIEQLTGQPFVQVLQEQVLQRAAMVDSGCFALDRLPERCANGYIPTETGDWRTNIYAIPIISQPDGGVFSTALDFTAFWDALLNYRLLKPETTTAMLHPHIQTEPGRAYGYGVYLIKVGDGWAYQALGSDPGVTFVSRVYPQQDILFTVMGNIEDPMWSFCGELAKYFAG
ncbi:MAG TPA: serine hydrolase [Phototrophicaceae bacterium]|nr:serine hydrolase [Phototrophicaceae bacterium]